MKFYKAIEDIWYGPSVQDNAPVQDEVLGDRVQDPGGFTKTNLPVGQIHYPSNPGFDTIPKKIKEGILLVYTWKSEALLFGALTPELAVAEAVDQIAEIHPQIRGQFEFGAIKAWYNDPAEQGAYALLNHGSAARHVAHVPVEEHLLRGRSHLVCQWMDPGGLGVWAESCLPVLCSKRELCRTVSRYTKWNRLRDLDSRK
ncbi:hypothetical protein GBAR_LOCUS14095 [Geodia barretti]|uniref:Amine oxidase domain-containing protein n=1 Tax=Geodia barretti TaxID=519541 RepID=A0AA35WPB7_GEOBA|nr:hypothetical protein GBAR_LOCUS14095 [Geodia barretti]